MSKIIFQLNYSINHHLTQKELNMTSIYSPQNINEAKEMAEIFSHCGRFNAQEILMMHACFGHHYGGNMGLTMTQAYSLKGKPTLNADAMAGIVRKSGLCRFIKIDSWDDHHCTLIMARKDEDFEHSYTYEIEMAEKQGLTRNANWAKMPKQMLRARCLTMGLRATFPEAVSGIYSADEIADNMVMNDEERLELVAESLGEEVKKKTDSTPRGQFISQMNEAPSAPPRPITPSQPPAHSTTIIKSESKPNEAGRDLRSFEGWVNFVEAFGGDPKQVASTLEAKGINPQELTSANHYLQSVGPFSSSHHAIFEEYQVSLLSQDDAQRLVEAFEIFYGPCALEVYEEDYKEALCAYVKIQSQPWRVELIQLLKENQDELDEEKMADLKKNALVCNNWLEYKSLCSYIKKLLK